MGLLAPLINLLSLWNQSLHLPAALAPVEQTMRHLEELAEQLTQTLLSSDRIDILLANLLVVAILAAITEECFFRGSLQRILSRCHSNAHVVIWTAAILFSAFHLQFLDFQVCVLACLGADIIVCPVSFGVFRFEPLWAVLQHYHCSFCSAAPSVGFAVLACTDDTGPVCSHP